MEGEEEGPVVESITTQGGAFELDPIPVGVRYRVIAGGPAGYLMRPLTFEASPDPIVLELEAIYGARIHLTGTDGERLRISGDTPAPCGWASRTPGFTLTVSVHTVRDVLLDPAWLEMPAMDDARPSDQHLTIVKGPFGPSELPVLHFGGRVAGYESFGGEYRLRRLDQPPLDIVIPLQRVEDCWGAVEIHVAGGLSLLERPAGEEVANVWLTELARGEKHVFAIRGSDDLPLVLEHLPCGVYSVYISGVVGHAPVMVEPDRPTIVEVSKGARTSCTIETREAGALELDVELPDGTKYEGPLVVMLMQGKIGDMLAFEAPPFMTQGIPVGDYQVTLESAAGQHFSPPQPEAHVSIESARAARVKLLVPPR